jgi:leader peptidase (prepilin peptidase)/N-methyltransferase
VVIYRLPLGISVNNPRRSYCPSCKNQIQESPTGDWNS